MDKIIIDGFDFWNMTAMKYWSHPKSYDIKKKKEESKYMCVSGNYIGARKYDGAWNMLIKDMDGNFHLRSRTESVNGGYTDKVEWIPWITEALASIPNGTVLLGEICFPNNEGSRKITSVLNCLKSKCIERQEKNGILCYYIFDVLAYDGKSLIDEAIIDRVTYIAGLQSTVPESDYILYANYVEGEDLWNLYGKTIAAGGEGIVITRKDCAYLPGKRTARMTLKMKKELNDTIDGFIDGSYKPATREYKGKEIQTWPYWENVKTGEKTCECKFEEYCDGQVWIPVTKAYYNDWASAISISVMKDDKPYHIAWISGITDELKDGIVHNRDKYIGKVVELTAMEIEKISDDYTLRHGKIVCFRDDKNASDCDFSQLVDKA